MPELLKRLKRVDSAIVEGFKRVPYRKIEVHQAGNGKFPNDPTIRDSD